MEENPKMDSPHIKSIPNPIPIGLEFFFCVPHEDLKWGESKFSSM